MTLAKNWSKLPQYTSPQAACRPGQHYASDTISARCMSCGISAACGSYVLLQSRPLESSPDVTNAQPCTHIRHARSYRNQEASLRNSLSRTRRRHSAFSGTSYRNRQRNDTHMQALPSTLLVGLPAVVICAACMLSSSIWVLCRA